jgi:hypothetical protein
LLVEQSKPTPEPNKANDAEVQRFGKRLIDFTDDELKAERARLSAIVDRPRIGTQEYVATVLPPTVKVVSAKASMEAPTLPDGMLSLD